MKMVRGSWSSGQKRRLDPSQGSGDPRERIGLDAEFLQYADKELCQGKFLRFYFSSPSRIGNDSGTGLVVFIALAKLEIATICEAEIFSTSRNDWIIAGEVETAGSGTMHGKRVIEHGASAGRLRGIP